MSEQMIRMTMTNDDGNDVINWVGAGLYAPRQVTDGSSGGEQWVEWWPVDDDEEARVRVLGTPSRFESAADTPEEHRV